MKCLFKKLLIIFVVTVHGISATAGMEGDKIIRPLEYAHSTMNFWDKIGYTEAKSEEVCGKLDIEQMNGFLDKVFEIGQSAIEAGDMRLAEGAFITLRQPNYAFNTEGDAETYYTKYWKQHTCSYPTFAKAVLAKGRSLFEKLMQCFEKKGGDKQKLEEKIGIGTII